MSEDLECGLAAAADSLYQDTMSLLDQNENLLSTIAQQAERIAELEEAMRNYFNACDSVDENLAEDDWPAMNRIQAAHNAMKALLAQGGSDE